MDIVYLGAFRLPNYDAAAARVLNVAKALRESGHQVTFISWGGQYRQEDLLSDGVYCIKGFRYIITNELDSSGSFISKLRGMLSRGNRTKQLLRNWPKKIDVIITYNGSLTKWLLSFCRDRSIKFINDMTEWYSYSELKITEWIPYAYNMFVTQKQVKNKIVISSLLDRFYKMTHNIVVPAMCDSEEPKWHEQIGDARSSLSGFNGITLIYAGNPARKDLVHSVINSVQRLADENRPIRFIVLGVNRDNYLLHYSSLLHSTDLHKNIVFLGRVSQDMIPSFYHQADFMVLLREQTRKSNAGFPTKFAEAMTSGIPVIANLTSDLGHYLIDGQTGIVVSESSEEAIYNTLNEKVLPLSQERISQLKQNVHQVSKQLDYRYYVNALNKYMSELD